MKIPVVPFIIRGQDIPDDEALPGYLAGQIGNY